MDEPAEWSVVIDALWGSLGGVEGDQAREPWDDVEVGVDERSRRGRGGGREPSCQSGLCGLVVRRRRDAMARDALAPCPRAPARQRRKRSERPTTKPRANSRNGRGFAQSRRTSTTLDATLDHNTVRRSLLQTFLTRRYVATDRT